MEHVSHQTMVMQFILELSKSLKVDPRQCVRPFFTRFRKVIFFFLFERKHSFRMKTADEQYKQGFFDELQAFRERVQQRAKQKIEDAIQKYEEVDCFLKKKKLS